MRDLRELILDFGIRSLVVLALLVPWYVLDWEWAVRWTASVTVMGLSPFCGDVAAVNGMGIVCDSQPFPFAKECTYLDLFLIAAPFLWSTRQRSLLNLRRLSIAFLLLWVLNSVRLVGSLAASAHGVRWELAHDLPDMLLYWPFLLAVLAGHWRRAADANAQELEPPRA